MEQVRVVFSKWGDRPHWEYAAQLLGTDEHGTWLGLPLGTRIARPGSDFETDQLQVVLTPKNSWFIATFYAPGGRVPCEVYVDVTTPPVWDGATVRAVDLDLDVLRGRTGRVWVDDEDEFADHRVRLAYPEEIIAAALISCEEVQAAVASRRPPYDQATSDRWLSHLIRNG